MEQEGKFILATRVSQRGQNRGVLTTLRGRGFLLLDYSCLKMHENSLGVMRSGMAMHSNPKKWDRMLDEGIVLG